MKSKSKKILAGGIVVFAAAALIFFWTANAGQDNMLTLRYYRDGKIIGNSWSPLSIITGSAGSVEGATSMDFVLKVKNTGTTTYSAVVDTATPAQFKAALPSTSLTVAPGQTASWTSSQIPTAQFDGTTQNFQVTVKGTYSYAGQARTISKASSVSLSFQPDPVAGMEVNLENALGASGGGSSGGGNTNPPDAGSGMGGNGNLKTTGTACAANSECQSGVCQGQPYIVYGPATCGSENPKSYTCNAANGCAMCECRSSCSSSDYPNIVIGCTGSIQCSSTARICA